MFKPRKSNKQDLMQGFADQDDSTATGKRLKNRRKKQKKIEKKVL
jgi:hypothetical protein